jgi:hypothetical protein
MVTVPLQLDDTRETRFDGDDKYQYYVKKGSRNASGYHLIF